MRTHASRSPWLIAFRLYTQSVWCTWKVHCSAAVAALDDDDDVASPSAGLRTTTSFRKIG